jgi:uncharacterized repeat protein (TIGR01451 family)
MKIFNKGSIVTLAVFVLIAGFSVYWLGRPGNTIPPGRLLSAAIAGAFLPPDNFAVLASTYTNTASTTITGDLGYTTGSAVTPTVSGTTHVADSAYNQAGTDQGIMLSDLNAEPCDFNFGSATDLSSLSQPLAPGTYCITGAASIGAPSGITLSGSGTYIFRITGALNTVANSTVVLAGGALPCDVFWTPTAATTLGANSTFVGTNIDASGITVGSTVGWTGRALAFGGTITTNNDTIAAPTCASPTSTTATLHIIKQVFNNNGGTATTSSFNLHVKLAGSEVAGSPKLGTTTPGTSYTLTAGTYVVSEDATTSYTQRFSGNCNSSGSVTLSAGSDRTCTITNSDIAPVVVPSVGGSHFVPLEPPLIDVVKVPSPLALPAGPGLVTYTYTLRNIGTMVAVSNITMVDDTCSPITFVSGDTNNDASLDVEEVWIYRCSTTVSQTHTNTVTATGWANGLIATDIANATVVVGTPVVPPLIHVTKVPSPLALLAGGGMITYTEKVTNPGTVALSNVSLADDKCSPMKYISGDTNGDSKLDTSETWIYTCAMNLAKTTTNSAIVSGEANGLTARDFAFATVVVAADVPTVIPNVATPDVPKLPKTGFPPK